MSCKTCDHTMVCLGQIQDGDRYFWCPRCGSLKRVVPADVGGGEDTDAPRLVDRCREFEAWCPQGDKWVTMGIAESIHVPGERP